MGCNPHERLLKPVQPSRFQSRRDPITQEEFLETSLRGRDLLEDPLLNKGTAWPQSEREKLDLLGLLPPHVSSIENQLSRVYRDFRRESGDLEKFTFLQAMQDRNEILFYRLLLEHLEEFLPIVYTPTVGQACQRYHEIFRRPRGIYIAAQDSHRTASIIGNLGRDTARIQVAVVTDGERILGLGDLGANGMGIPIGKLSLYVAGGGFHPAETLPILLDTGTDNDDLRLDPLYLGLHHERLRGEAYDSVVDNFVEGFQQACPNAILQFEDFAKGNASRLLARYQDSLPCFNDDIQGTGAVTLAVILAATRFKKTSLSQERFLIIGAGSAGIGIARAIQAALNPELPGQLLMRDSRGILILQREHLSGDKQHFAVDGEWLSSVGLPSPSASLTETIQALKPTTLIGTTGQAGLFDASVIQAMTAATPRPLILPLSNPTANSEADPQEVVDLSKGRALVATGSPYPPVHRAGRSDRVAQCNNVFAFPGVGLGAALVGAKRITDVMFLKTARALASVVDAADLQRGILLPPSDSMRACAVRVAAAVAKEALESRLATVQPTDPDLEKNAQQIMWIPRYLPVHRPS